VTGKYALPMLRLAERNRPGSVGTLPQRFSVSADPLFKYRISQGVDRFAPQRRTFNETTTAWRTQGTLHAGVTDRGRTHKMRNGHPLLTPFALTKSANPSVSFSV